LSFFLLVRAEIAKMLGHPLAIPAHRSRKRKGVRWK
jgi:hypothetical protein